MRFLKTKSNLIYTPKWTKLKKKKKKKKMDQIAPFKNMFTGIMPPKPLPS